MKTIPAIKDRQRGPMTVPNLLAMGTHHDLLLNSLSRHTTEVEGTCVAVYWRASVFMMLAEKYKPTLVFSGVGQTPTESVLKAVEKIAQHKMDNAPKG